MRVMQSLRTHDPDDLHLLDPAVRVIEFAKEPAVATLSSLLRIAWRSYPSDDNVGRDSLISFLSKLSHREEHELTEDEENPDTKDLTTPWRLEIMSLWDFVLTDTSTFLFGASGTVGTLNGYQSLVVPRPDDSSIAAIESISYEYNVIIIPTYLAPGVTIRITRDRKPTDGDDSTERFVTNFGMNEVAVMLFLRHGFTYNFYVDHDNDESSDYDGSAAVFVVGKMWIDDYCDYRITELQTRDDKGIGAGSKMTNIGHSDAQCSTLPIKLVIEHDEVDTEEKEEEEKEEERDD